MIKRFYPTGAVTLWSYNGYAWTFVRHVAKERSK